MKELIDIFKGYSKPGTPFTGVAPLGNNGLSIRIRYILYLERAYKYLTRPKCHDLGMQEFYPMFHTHVGMLAECWVAEIMRIMDRPNFGERENLGVPLAHEKFRVEPSINVEQRVEEQRLFDALTNRYDADGYKRFRDRHGFHIDLEDALNEPSQGGNLNDMSRLIFDWYRYVATIVYKGEPKFFTEGAVQQGRQMAKQFARTMIDALRGERDKVRQRRPRPQLRRIIPHGTSTT